MLPRLVNSYEFMSLPASLTTMVVKIEDQEAAEVERRLKQMGLEKQTGAQVQPAQASQPVGCEICGGPHFTVQCVATAQQVEEINFLKQNNPYSNTYNPGWKNHPNFSWKDQSGSAPKQGIPPYQGQQSQQQYRPPQQHYQQPQQQAPRKADWELAIEKMAAQSSQFQEETRINFRNTGASIKNLEVQMSQIAQQLANAQPQGALPSGTITNPREHQNVNVISTRSLRRSKLEEKNETEYGDIIEVDLEVRENPKEPEVVISPVKPLEEKN